MALTVVAVTGALVVRKAATDQALAEARQLTEVSARIVEQRVNDGLLTGDAESIGRRGTVVFDAVKIYPIVSVKIWDRDGTILYSDQTELIGSTYELGEDELEVIDDGGVVSDVSDLSEAGEPVRAGLRRVARGVHAYRHRPEGRGDTPAVRDLSTGLEHRRPPA